jgi:hypothetical protein
MGCDINSPIALDGPRWGGILISHWHWMGRDGVRYLFPTGSGWAEMGWDINSPISLDGPRWGGIFISHWQWMGRDS